MFEKVVEIIKDQLGIDDKECYGDFTNERFRSRLIRCS